jgi:hypothetical protein
MKAEMMPNETQPNSYIRKCLKISKNTTIDSRNEGSVTKTLAISRQSTDNKPLQITQKDYKECRDGLCANTVTEKTS